MTLVSKNGPALHLSPGYKLLPSGGPVVALRCFKCPAGQNPYSFPPNGKVGMPPLVLGVRHQGNASPVALDPPWLRLGGGRGHKPCCMPARLASTLLGCDATPGPRAGHVRELQPVPQRLGIHQSLLLVRQSPPSGPL